MTSARDNNGEGLPRVPSIPLTDEAAFDATGNQSIGHLVRDATTHMSTLVRAEIELAKAEVMREVRKALVGGAFFIVALAAALYIPIFVGLTVIEVLANWLPRYAATLIVVFVMVVLVAALVFIGYRQMRKIKAPERTITTLKDAAAVLGNLGADEERKELSTDVAGIAPRPT